MNDPAIVVILGEGNKKIRLAILEFSILDELINTDFREMV